MIFQMLPTMTRIMELLMKITLLLRLVIILFWYYSFQYTTWFFTYSYLWIYTGNRKFSILWHLLFLTKSLLYYLCEGWFDRSSVCWMFKGHCFIIYVEDSLIYPQFDECLSHCFITCVKNDLIGPQFVECLKDIDSLFMWRMIW